MDDGVDWLISFIPDSRYCKSGAKVPLFLYFLESPPRAFVAYHSIIALFSVYHLSPPRAFVTSPNRPTLRMATKGLGIGEKMLGTSNRPYLHRAISTALYAHIGAASALVASLATAQDLPIDRDAIALEPVEIVAADGDADSGTTKTGTIRIQIGRASCRERV